VPIGAGITLSYLFTQLLSVASLVIVAIERRRHGDGPLRDRADLMFWAAVVSFLRSCSSISRVAGADALPVSRRPALVVPVPGRGGFGIARGQLFEVRNCREVVSRLRRRDARDHGVFAF
jgi:hypothetical protein